MNNDEVSNLVEDTATAQEYYDVWLKEHGAKVMRPREIFYHGFILGMKHVRDGGKL